MPKLYKFKPLKWKPIVGFNGAYGPGAERANIFEGYVVIYRYGEVGVDCDEEEWRLSGRNCDGLHMSKKQVKAMANRIVRDIAKDFLEEVRPPRKRGKR
jgi:hypothetical protein